MKKLALLITICGVTFFSNPVNAQIPKNTGEASRAGTTQAETSFAWGIGLGGLVVIGTIAGLVAASARCCSKVAH